MRENGRLESDNKKLVDAGEALVDRPDVRGDERALRAELKSAQAKIDAYSDELRNKKSECESQRHRHREDVSRFLHKLHEARETTETTTQQPGDLPCPMPRPSSNIPGQGSGKGQD